jgi:lipopolysaccharide/colanic/teichoic acid biosynthesis glycosyltransferase
VSGPRQSPPTTGVRGVEGRQTTESLARKYAEMPHIDEGRGIDVVLRALDLAISGTTLLVLSPLLILVAVATRLSSGSPILYRGERVGRRGHVFEMYKFRTLAVGAESRLGNTYGEELTRRTDAEVTALGRVLRAVHLDEVPQLLNVLGGQMSIVGPRPIRPTFFEEISERLPQYWQRLAVRPGVTGFAQTRITREDSWDDKLSHDMEYIADRSLGLYFRVIFATVARVIVLAFRRS